MEWREVDRYEEYLRSRLNIERSQQKVYFKESYKKDLFIRVAQRSSVLSLIQITKFSLYI